MLTLELKQKQYSKTAHWSALVPQLDDRSKGSIEFKYVNISAALRDLGYPFVDGYKPYSNYQGLVLEVVQDAIARSPQLIALIERDIAEPSTAPTPDNILSVLV